MMKSLFRNLLAVVFTLSYISQASSQHVHEFTTGLRKSIESNYGREALYTDHLAYGLYTNTLKLDSSWKPVRTDTIKRFWFRGAPQYIYHSYQSETAQPALLNVQGASSVFFNGRPHAADPYRSGWLYIPVQLKKGLNELFIRGGFGKASLYFPDKPVFVSIADSTVPHIIVGQSPDSMQAAVVIINTSSANLGTLTIEAEMQGKKIRSTVPVVPAMSVRKVPFTFASGGINRKDKFECSITLYDKKKAIDNKVLPIESVQPGEQYSGTFISNIDGSLQYYAVTPQAEAGKNSALFLSVHGAGVEAIGQARAYRPKDWGTLIAATNRRPRGFNWEDWGRLDALEVLAIGQQKFNPDPNRIYLTGHSMGGHGTWFLGATYPDKWAAIAPCAGYPTLKGYGSADGLIPDSSGNKMEQLLLRSSNQSDVIRLARNYNSYGVYIFHGDSDKVVSVNYARQMKKILADFHKDMSYYEYPGGEHWFGDISVDWKPLFDFFKWHRREPDSSKHHIEFITASPGISSDYYWASVHQQHFPLTYSKIDLTRQLSANRITGSTENVRLLKLKLDGFGANTPLTITLDSLDPIKYTTKIAGDSVFLVNDAGKWKLSSLPSLKEKGPHRYGTLKDAFNHRMIFVYGTTGNKEENDWSIEKARYDAETWYYRGNGAVDIIADKEYSISKYKDRGVILYGNENTNAAWKLLLADCPIKVKRNAITLGNDKFEGDDLAAYFVWPQKSSDLASVGVITGTGIKGMKAANANQYFAGASGFPDIMIYSCRMLQEGAGEVRAAGFFDYKWEIDNDNIEIKK